MPLKPWAEKGGRLLVPFDQGQPGLWLQLRGEAGEAGGKEVVGMGRAERSRERKERREVALCDWEEQL